MDKTINKTGGVLLAVLFFLTVIQVFFRYVLNNPLPWPEEIARYSFIWITYIGLYKNMVEKDHYRIDFLYNMLGERIRRIVDVLFSSLMLIFLIVAVISSISILIANAHIMSPNNISVDIIYAALPVMAVLILIRKLGTGIKSILRRGG